MTLVAVTYYTYTVGAPLYCGGVVDYSREWVAWDFAANGGQCGDTISITTADGVTRRYLALDSGRFGRYCVRQRDGSCPPIKVDVPAHVAWFPGLSTLAVVVNLSQRARWGEFPQ